MLHRDTEIYLAVLGHRPSGLGFESLGDQAESCLLTTFDGKQPPTRGHGSPEWTGDDHPYHPVARMATPVDYLRPMYPTETSGLCERHARRDRPSAQPPVVRRVRVELLPSRSVGPRSRLGSHR